MPAIGRWPMTHVAVALFSLALLTAPLEETVPGVRWVAVLWEPTDATANFQMRPVRAAASALGLDLQMLEVPDPIGLNHAFSAMRAQALLVLPAASFATDGVFPRIAGLATTFRLPAMFDFPAYVRKGGLMSYRGS